MKDESVMTKELILPVLPLRDIVVFPYMVVPLFVGRSKSIKALEDVMSNNKKIMLLTQKNSDCDDPEYSDVYHQGIIAKILQLLKLPDGTVRVLVEGESRAEVKEFTKNTEYMEANVSPSHSTIEPEDDIVTITGEARALFESFGKLNKKISEDIINSIVETKDPSKLTDLISVHLNADIVQKQGLLDTMSVTSRLENIIKLLSDELALLEVEKKIRGRVKRQMEKTQKDYYLNEQMKAIQNELGGTEGNDEFSELQERVSSVKLSKEAKEKVDVEIKKLRQMSPMSAEANVSRNYLDWILSVPWNKKKRLQRDLTKAQNILDEDHYGLVKIKERIIEHLAVQTRTKRVKGPIICLVGPPGVGKTSLGKSVARATGREFVRVSLGGVSDESEIRGHRRTYIGSMPGRIIQSMKKAKYNNPLFLFDEIDKLGSDHRGDPSSALLEVLDPEQNNTFNDHYLDVDFDLSDVMFLTTANSLNMQQPLLDRMEIIRIPGYTESEKIEIAKLHLIPTQIKEHGLKNNEFFIEDEALKDIVRYYTREAGVRGLKKELATLARKSLTNIISKKSSKIIVTTENIHDFLGARNIDLVKLRIKIK
jgi:ATP-dependent Lon protease